MSKFRKLMAIATLLFASSSVFVACSDDDETTMGPISINSVKTTSSSVTLFWTIVSNGSCDGYNVTIVEGTRANKGAVVVSEDFEARTARGTFTGLKQNTSYVAITKGIPSKSSGFSDAYTFELEFMTAPLIQNIVAGPVTFEDVVEKDENGNDVTRTLGTFTATWNALSTNAGTYTVSLQRKNTENNTWAVVTNVTINNISTGSYVFEKKLVPDTRYRVGVLPNPGNIGWYAAGEWQYSPEFTTSAQ